MRDANRLPATAGPTCPPKSFAEAAARERGISRALARELVAFAVWLGLGVLGFGAIAAAERMGAAWLLAAGVALILTSALAALWTGYRTSMLDREEGRG